MKFENKSFTMETVKEVREVMKNNLYGDEPIINGGYPLFNTCGHTTIDMSNISETEETKMHTLSIKIGEGEYVTLCVMPMQDGKYINIDVKLHSENENRVHKAIHFPKLVDNKQSHDTIRISDFNLLALISELKK